MDIDHTYISCRQHIRWSASGPLLLRKHLHAVHNDSAIGEEGGRHNGDDVSRVHGRQNNIVVHIDKSEADHYDHLPLRHDVRRRRYYLLRPELGDHAMGRQRTNG